MYMRPVPSAQVRSTAAPVVGHKPTFPVTAEGGMSVIAVSATITKLPAVKRFIGAGPWPAPPTPMPAPGAVGGPLATRIGDPSLPPPLPQPATDAATSIITSHIS